MLSALIAWMDDEALPFWFGRGFDDGRDLFHERLSFIGAPLPIPYRAMVQARQIYVFSHGAMLGLSNDYADRADRAMRGLLRSFAVTSGGETSFAFSIDAQTGRHVSTVRDSYTHAFVLLAAALLYRTTGDAALVRLVEEVCLFIDRRLTVGDVPGVIDALPISAMPDRRQNPQMHLLEAYLALEEAMPGRGHLERAHRVVALFHDHLFDAETGVLLEHFAADWTEHPDRSRSNSWEPGHHYEWVWLLEQFDNLAGTKLAPERDALWHRAQADGHAAVGLIYDEVAADGRIIAGGHRLWPLTEAIKAATTLHRSGDPSALDFAAKMADLLLKTFLDRPFSGGWIDHFTADLSPRVDYVPASSLYHLFLATAEARRA